MAGFIFENEYGKEKSYNTNDLHVGAPVSYQDALSPLETFRSINKCYIWLKTSTGTHLLYEAYHPNGLSLSYGSSYQDLPGSFIDKINSMPGISKMFINGATSSSISANFDINLKPMIGKANRLEFTANTFLYAQNSFMDDVLKPLNTLLVASLPRKAEFNTTIDELKKSINDFVEDNLIFMEEGDGKATNRLFKSMDKDNVPDTETQKTKFEKDEARTTKHESKTVWGYLYGMWKSLYDTYLENLSMIRDPEQYVNDNDIIVKVGSVRIPKCIIKNIKVDWGPNAIHAKGPNNGNVYVPQYAKVSISFITKFSALPENLNIGVDYYGKGEQLGLGYDEQKPTNLGYDYSTSKTGN